MERNKDLVEELRTKHRQQDETPPSVITDDFKATIGPEDATEKNVEKTLSATYLGKMFDYYTKELVRLREERRLSAMVLLAERTRKLREDAEIGKNNNIIIFYAELVFIEIRS